MGLLKDSLDRMHFDKRMIQINIRTKVIGEDQYKQHLQQLPDESHRSVNLELTGEAGSSSQKSQPRTQFENPTY